MTIEKLKKSRAMVMAMVGMIPWPEGPVRSILGDDDEVSNGDHPDFGAGLAVMLMLL